MAAPRGVAGETRSTVSRPRRIGAAALFPAAVLVMTTTCRSPCRVADNREEGWRHDIECFASNLRTRHGDPFGAWSRREFDAEIRRLSDSVTASSDETLTVGLMRIAARIGDAHTWVQPPPNRLPLAFHFFADGVFVFAADTRHEAALGGRLEAVGGTPIAQVLKELGPLVADEGNPSWRKLQLARLLCQPQVLYGVGLSKSTGRARYRIRTRQGVDIDIDTAVLQGPEPIRWQSARQAPLPKYLRSEPWFFEWWEKERTLYFAYNACQAQGDKHDRRDKREQQFTDFCSQLFAEADRRDGARLIVDLRRNGGGNSTVLEPFLAGLARRPKLDRRDRLYVLIGRQTFSSACLNAHALATRTNALLVGEPTGGNPHSRFREATSFVLPNSKLRVHLTTRVAFDRATERQRTTTPAVMPDIPVEPKAAEYFAGADPVLDTALGR